jgi:hypothetical protein
VRTNVSQFLAPIDGIPACARCGRRPRRVYPRAGQGGRRKFYSYCKECHTEYVRGRRAGKVQVLVTPEEWQLLLELRAEPKGRHHAVSA